MRLNLWQVQRVRLCPLKTVTGQHTQTVLGHLGVVRAAGVDNRWEGHGMLAPARETSRLQLGSINIQGAPTKNNPLGKIHYLSYCNRFFHQIYSFLQRRIRATYTANFVTIFAVVWKLQQF